MFSYFEIKEKLTILLLNYQIKPLPGLGYMTEEILEKLDFIE